MKHQTTKEYEDNLQAEEWNAEHIITSGLDASKPESGLAVGQLYWATDSGVLYRATSETTWEVLLRRRTWAYKINSYYCENYGREWQTYENIPAHILYTAPLELCRRVRLDRIGFQVVAAGGGADKARLGIYTTDAETTLQPYQLVAGTDVGEIDTSILGWRYNSINVWLNEGLYSLALLHNDSGLDVERITAAEGGVRGILGTLTGGGVPKCMYRVSQVYGALPATFPLPAVQDSYLLNIMVRIAELG
jgi:hypothetical protein